MLVVTAMYGNYAAKKLEINCSQVFNFVPGNTAHKYFIYKIRWLFSATAMKYSCRSVYIAIHRHGSLGKIFIKNILNYERRLFEHVKIIKLKAKGHTKSFTVIFFFTSALCCDVTL